MSTTTNEVWLPVIGYEGIYEVSDFGRVRSLARAIGSCHGSTRRIPEKILKPIVTAKGYRQVNLCKDGVKKVFRLHRVVAVAFLGPVPDDHEVAHNDGDRANNALLNLRHSLHVDNIADKITHGTAQIGNKNSNAKLSESDVRAIKSLLASGIDKAEIAKQFEVSRTNIYWISTGASWGHVCAHTNGDHDAYSNQ